MLLLGGVTNRLSIDIDIMCPPGTEIEKYLSSFKDFGFTKFDLMERKSPGKDIPKSHSKFFYQLTYADKGGEGCILLDVLYENCHYQNTLEIPIANPFIEIDGEQLLVRVPSVEDILGDKLTAFAPNTTGIPYYKGKKVCSVEIIKQMYDIARLFERVDDLTVTTEAFNRIVKVEMAYRNLDNVEDVYNDIIQTSLLIATRGKEGTGDFTILSDGIKKIRNFIHTSNYHLDHAIIDSSRATYLAACLKTGTTILEKYNGNLNAILAMEVKSPLPSKLSKLRKTYPEAFFYWVKASELLADGNA